MALHDFDVSDCITVISTLAAGLIVVALLPALLGGGTYLVCRVSIRQQHRVCILQRHVDWRAQHLDEIEVKREVRRFMEYPFEWRVSEYGLWGGPELYRHRPVVLERGYWVFVQRDGEDLDEMELFDTTELRQGTSTGACEHFEQQSAAHRQEVEELQQWLQHLGQELESESAPEHGQADDELALGARVRDISAEWSRGIGGAVDPRNYGIGSSAHSIRRSLSSSSDSDEVSPEKNSLQSAATAKSMSGSTLCDSTNEECNEYQFLRRHHSATHSSERPGYHFEYWHHNNDDDPDPIAPHPHWPVVEEITIRHDIDVESTPIDKHTGPVPSRNVDITGPTRSHGRDGIPAENRIYVPTCRSKRAHVAPMSRDLENAHSRRDGRSIKKQAALLGAGLAISDAMPPDSTANNEGANGSRGEGHTPDSSGILHKPYAGSTEEETVRIYETYAPWPDCVQRATEANPSVILCADRLEERQVEDGRERIWPGGSGTRDRD